MGRGRGSLLIHGVVAFTLSSNKLPTIVAANHPAAGKSLLNFCLFNPFFFHTSTAPKFTNPNPNPKPRARDSLQQLLLEKCKLGFDNLDDALVLFDRMLQMRPLPSVIDFAQLLAALAKMKHYSVVVSLFGDICALTNPVVPVDVVTITTVINCCCHCNRVDYGFSLLGVMFKRGFVPNVFTYNTLIKGLLSENKFLEAEELFKKLIRTKETEPNVVTITTVINCCCHCNRVDYGFSLLGFIFKRGLVPNVFTYTTLIRGLLSANKFVEAEELFEKLTRTKETEPNVVMYGTIINGLCKVGNTSMAIRLLRIMENGGCEPNNVVYNTIVDRCCKEKLLDDALDLFSEMIRKGISPDVYNFTILVDALCKEGKVKEAENVVEQMIQSGENPNVVTYSALMDGYCLRGEMDSALAVLNTMMIEGIVPNNHSYSILIKGYCMNLRVDNAMDLFRKMPSEGLKPTIVDYNTILHGLFKMGRYGDAQFFLNEMQAQGHIPPRQKFLPIVLED